MLSLKLPKYFSPLARYKDPLVAAKAYLCRSSCHLSTLRRTCRHWQTPSRLQCKLFYPSRFASRLQALPRTSLHRDSCKCLSVTGRLTPSLIKRFYETNQKLPIWRSISLCFASFSALGRNPFPTSITLTKPLTASVYSSPILFPS